MPNLYSLIGRVKNKDGTVRKEGYLCWLQRDIKGLSYICVPGQRQIEINKDVTFDEDATFLRSRESHLDVETEEHEAPNVIEDPIPDSPRANMRREEHSSPDYIPDSVDPVEPLGPSERHIDAPPAKRRPTWLRETL